MKRKLNHWLRHSKTGRAVFAVVALAALALTLPFRRDFFGE